MDNKPTRRYYDRGDKRGDLRDALSALKEMVLDRSHSLETEQKALLTMILEHGSTYEQVARLRGEHASTVSRRFKRLLRRLSHRVAEKPPVQMRNLKPMEQTILAAYYLCGMNQSQIAAKLEVSRYRVRKTLAPYCATEPKRASCTS